MAKTVQTSATTYCDAATFLLCFDRRLVGDLCQDMGIRADPSALPTNPTLAALLLQASGEVESAAMVGGRYHTEDLAALTGAGKAFLQRLVAAITIGFLFSRRSNIDRPVPREVEWAEAQVELLRMGNRVFPLTETMASGNPDTTALTESDFQTANRSTVIAQRYFGTRGWRK